MVWLRFSLQFRSPGPPGARPAAQLPLAPYWKVPVSRVNWSMGRADAGEASAAEARPAVISTAAMLLFLNMVLLTGWRGVDGPVRGG